MERGEGVLAHGLDGHRKNLLVPVSLEQSLGVRAVVLAPASIRPYEVRWEQDDVVSQPSQRPCPEVSRAAGFEKHGGSTLFRKKRHQLGSTHTELLGHLPRFARDGNLEDVLCKTHSDRRIFHSDSSFFDAFFRLTLAHRCRLCQRRSPSHHLMAEAPTIKYRCIFWKQPIHHGGRVQITKSLTFQVFPRGGSAGAGSSLPFERIGGAVRFNHSMNDVFKLEHYYSPG